MSKIRLSVKSVFDVLQYENLKIPEYQRPYKWERRHIRNLFYDIRDALKRNKQEYRIGSIILHNKDLENVDIVDGQQRLISISLFLYHVASDNLPAGAKNLLSSNYSGISQQHAKENYDEWRYLCNLNSEEDLDAMYDFLMNRCKFSVIEMPIQNLAQAFQLFDSQNNRGKALEPHDLLKAYHLRAIKKPDNHTIELWERFIDDERLSLRDLFDKHLFRIRRWVNGDTGLYQRRYGSELRFSERFLDDFKGVNLVDTSYPYLKLYEELRKHKIAFPNSICMPVINGQAFFHYVEFSYHFFRRNFIEDNLLANFLPPDQLEIVRSNKSKYSRNINMFVNIVATFIDRFGKDKLTREICGKVFVWAFYPRIVSIAIYDTTMANYAAGGIFRRRRSQKLFQVLVTSSSPDEFVSRIDTGMLDNLTPDEVVQRLKEGV